ncbi:MAG: carbon storage regulator [Aeromonadaceae bacterium]
MGLKVNVSPGEQVVVGEFTITLLGLQGRAARLDITAPAHIEINRLKVWLAKEEAKHAVNK